MGSRLVVDGIFLHAGWRTAGTLLWHVLRANPGLKTFYEPLHECFGVINAKMIETIGAQSWNSRHPASFKPYFVEYLPLLNALSGSGIAGYATRFAFDDFFLSEDATDDQLRDYIERMIGTARQENRLPVLKFTRSLGRLPWFRAQFPQMVHAVIIRDPWSQFRSAWQVRMQNGNGYFFAVPFLVLERSRALPEVAALIAALDLPVHGMKSTEPLARLEFWRLAVQRMKLETLYRGSFAFWLLNYSRAAQAGDFVLDTGAPASEMSRVFARHTGLELALESAMAPAAQKLQFYRNQMRPTAAAIRHVHALAQEALAPFVDAAVLSRLAAFIARAAAQAELDLSGQAMILPKPSVGGLVGLHSKTAYYRVKSRLGAGLPS